MRSALYTGHVAHNRPGKHRLRYKLFMLALDLDELPGLARRLKLLTRNEPGLLAFYDRDHAARRDAPLRPQIEALVREAGISWDGARILLLTMPRMMNYVFNPLSVYFCLRRDGSVAALVHEVSNTFGERHAYVLAPAAVRDGRILQACDKEFFVSPFLEQEGRYEFCGLPPEHKVNVWFIVRRGEEAALAERRHRVAERADAPGILRAVAGNPLMSLKVIAAIHWEALQMWLKGIPYLGRPDAETIPKGHLSCATSPRLETSTLRRGRIPIAPVPPASWRYRARPPAARPFCWRC